VDSAPPLAMYHRSLIEFIDRLTPIQLVPEVPPVLRLVERGRRSNLGMYCPSANALVAAAQLSSAMIAWRMLCFPNQVTVVHGRNQKRALRWRHMFMAILVNFDPLIAREFAEENETTIVVRSTLGRIIVQPNQEGPFEAAEPWITNAVYYDFDRVPEWVIANAQRVLASRPSHLSLALLLNAPANGCAAHPTEPTGQYDDGPDGAADDD